MGITRILQVLLAPWVGIGACPAVPSTGTRQPGRSGRGHPGQTQPSWQGKDVVKRPDTEARHKSVCGAVRALSALSEENPFIDFYIHVQKYVLHLLVCV